MPERPTTTVLHYLGYDEDRGGIVSVVRALAGAGRCACVLGVNPGFVQARAPALATLALPALAGESISPGTLWRARGVAREVRAWLGADATRVFHGHSRAGLLVALWLARGGERRAVASVHCYGRQRWFYRWAARRLGSRLFWLSPAMKRHYGVAEPESWIQCIPGAVAAGAPPAARRERAPADPVRLGGAGALVPWKRWHLVLDALACLAPGVRARIRFVHIGSPLAGAASHAYAADLRRQTMDRGFSDNVEWRGEQAGTGALLGEIDALVTASRAEPLSVALLEALGAGVPVVASRSGGNVDVVAEGRTGWFFAPDDAADLARVFTRLAVTDALHRAEVRPADLARFEAGTVAEQWRRVYAERCAPRRGSDA